uniref:Uncharacterized protein LOC104214201 n=1 Tax=Nicotiana sylvestris TaxID=4096 RepID=A0A1U7VAY8_NICSY|nr:PREDICTED: uncharacterized protein LOC104214201 [Nicotiana sylvestris]
MLTQDQEDLRVSSNRVQFLESSLDPLQAFYDAALNEKEELRSEIEQWERDYESLEDKAAIEVSWDFLNTCHDTLMEASWEGFDLDTEITKIKETIEKTQQNQGFSSPAVDIPEGDEVTPSEATVQSPSTQVVPPATDDVILHPTSSDSAPH